MSEIQSIAFKKSMWSIDDIMDWLDEHDIMPKKLPDISKNYIRVRIHNPKKYSSIRAKKIKEDGIILYFGFD